MPTVNTSLHSCFCLQRPAVPILTPVQLLSARHGAFTSLAVQLGKSNNHCKKKNNQMCSFTGRHKHTWRRESQSKFPKAASDSSHPPRAHHQYCCARESPLVSLKWGTLKLPWFNAFIFLKNISRGRRDTDALKVFVFSSFSEPLRGKKNNKKL